MVARDELMIFLNNKLNPAAFRDYCPNGLQVAGSAEIRTIVAGVSACQALLDAAIESQADLILVHHGYFWKGEDPCLIGYKRERIKTLLVHDINLIAYHLPLDAHAVIGNNVMLAKQLGLPVTGTLPMQGGEPSLLFYCDLPTPMAPEQLSVLLAQSLGRKPQQVLTKCASIKRIAWCTGGAQSFIEDAIRAGADAYISGEISEQTVHAARESGVHYYGAGHHATERYGVQALAQLIEQQFPEVTQRFIDIDNFV